MSAIITPNAQLTTTKTTSGTSITGTAPSGVKQYDCMIAMLVLAGTTQSALTFPAGWTSLGNVITDGTNCSAQAFFKVATNADIGATYAISWTTSSTTSAVNISAWTGADPINPIAVANPSPLNPAGLSADVALAAAVSANASSSSVTCPSLAVLEQNSMLISIYVAKGSSITVDASETQAGSTTNTITGDCLAIGYLNKVALTSSTGTVTGTSNQTSTNLGFSIMLSPPTWTQNNAAPGSCSNLSVVSSYIKCFSATTGGVSGANGSWQVTFGSFVGANDTWSYSAQPGDVVLVLVESINPGLNPNGVTIGYYQTQNVPTRNISNGGPYSSLWVYEVPRGVPLSGNNGSTLIECAFQPGQCVIMMVAVRGAAGQSGIASVANSGTLGNQTFCPAPAPTLLNGNSMMLGFWTADSAQTPTVVAPFTSIAGTNVASGYGGSMGYWFPGDAGTMQTQGATTTNTVATAYMVVIAPPIGQQTVGGFPFYFVSATGATFSEPAFVTGTQPSGAVIVTGYASPAWNVGHSIPESAEYFTNPVLMTGVANGTGTIIGDVTYLGSGMANIQVLLYQSNGGVFCQETVTNGSGKYAFYGLQINTTFQNDYFVVIQCPALDSSGVARIGNGFTLSAPVFNSIILDQIQPY